MTYGSRRRWQQGLLIGALVAAATRASAQTPYPCPMVGPITNSFDVPTVELTTPYATFWVNYGDFSGPPSATSGFYVPDPPNPVDYTGRFIWTGAQIGVTCSEDYILPAGYVLFITWTGYIGGIADFNWDGSGSGGSDNGYSLEWDFADWAGGTQWQCYDVYYEDTDLETVCVNQS